MAIQVTAGTKAGIIGHGVDGSDWVNQGPFVTENSFRPHGSCICFPRDGHAPEQARTLTVRISEKRNELGPGNDCRIVYFGLNGDPRSPKGVNVDGIYLDGSGGHGPEKLNDATCLRQSQILTMAASATAEAEAD